MWPIRKEEEVLHCESYKNRKRVVGDVVKVGKTTKEHGGGPLSGHNGS